MHAASEIRRGKSIYMTINAEITCRNQCAAYLVRICESHLSERHEGQQTHLKTRPRLGA